MNHDPLSSRWDSTDHTDKSAEGECPPSQNLDRDPPTLRVIYLGDHPGEDAGGVFAVSVDHDWACSQAFSSRYSTDREPWLQHNLNVC